MGVLHAISAFNNAGFGLNAGGLIPYVGDAWIVLPIGLAIVFGGLGFPVLAELIARVRLRRQRRKPPRQSMTARITLIGTAVLLIGGFVMFWARRTHHPRRSTRHHYPEQALLLPCRKALHWLTQALKQLGVKDFQQVVIGIGSSLEASILTASNLVELGVKDIWAKAGSDAHARILTRVGVHHVVRPERDTGRRVAHLLSGRFQDYTVFDQGYAMITLRAPKELVNHSLNRHSLWAKHRVQLVAVHSGNQWPHLLPSTSSPLTTTSFSPARPPTWKVRPALAPNPGASRPSPDESGQP